MKQMRLQAELLLRRFGWLPLIAVLAVGAAVWLHYFASAELKAQSTAHREMARANPQIRAALSNDSDSVLQARYAAFRDLLIDRGVLLEVVRTIFAEAAKNNLALEQVDYKMAPEASGEFLVYRISIPIRGSYTDVRRFASGVLAGVHSAALEEVAFKRDSIGAPVTEAKLSFAVFLKKGE